MGLKAFALAVGACGFVLATMPADAQRTRFQGINQCSRFGSAQFSRHDSSFRRFVIERATVQEDKFADFAGNQFVSTVYYGRATYEGGAGPKRVRFICLYGGYSKGPVFVYTLPE